jgi:CRP-like cAMP-binding protein
MDRVYRLLGLIYPWKDVSAARYAIERGEARSRSSALEYLDNILTGNVRKRIMPMLDDMPLDEKVRRGNVLLKTRVRDAEETLLQLINDEDPVVSASAIDLVEEQKIWGLADDLEHVLAHRDVKDWYVFEAASWALAAHRMPESRRRALWVEPLPAVQLAARLRQVPLFGSVSVDELFRVAGMGRQVRYEAGRVLYQEGGVPDQVQFLLDGSVTVKGRADEATALTPPAALGFEQALEGSAMADTIRTAETSVSLALTTDEVRTLVSDNTDLVQGLFRMLVSRAATDRVVIKAPSAAPLATLSPGPLKAVDKGVVIETLPLLNHLSAEETMALAGIAREVPLTEGAALFAEADPPAIYAVLAGVLTLESAADSGKVVAGPGDVVGFYETLAGVPLDRRATVTQGGRALRIDREELFDLLGQRPALLQQLFGALFRSPAPEPMAA